MFAEHYPIFSVLSQKIYDMAAPKGNSFWTLRLTHGRKHAIATPDELWSNFIEYAKWIEENPLLEIDFRGKDAYEVQIPKMRPFTKEGFALACGLSGWEVIEEWKKREGFLEIITRIEKYIYTQKFEGAAAGLLNHNIIARDLGLADKTENKNTHELPETYNDFINRLTSNAKSKADSGDSAT